MLRRSAAASFVVVLAACHSASGASRSVAGPAAPGKTTSVRLLSRSAPMTCADWVAKAKSSPEMDVEQVPAPLAYDPAPIPRRLPPGVVGPDGTAEVRIKVLVDTLGRADMRTFKVVRSTHPTLTKHVRSAVAQWKFSPARVHGCKVPRMFNWGAAAGGGAGRKK